MQRDEEKVGWGKTRGKFDPLWSPAQHGKEMGYNWRNCFPLQFLQDQGELAIRAAVHDDDLDPIAEAKSQAMAIERR